MKLIEGKKQRYLLENETPKGKAGDYFLQENGFMVDLWYINEETIDKIAQYTKEYSKKVPTERLEQIIEAYYGKDNNRL